MASSHLMFTLHFPMEINSSRTRRDGHSLWRPLNAGIVSGRRSRRQSSRVVSVILAPAEAPSSALEVTAVPRLASLSDRMEIMGHGFCGDADANRVMIGGVPALVLASSPAYLAVLPPQEMDPGPATVEVRCGQKSSEGFTVVFVNLELETKSSTLAPGEHQTLQRVRITGKHFQN